MITLSAISTFLLSTLGGQAILGTGGTLLLGLFLKSKMNKTFREAWGRVCEGAGVAVSAIGNTRLKILWNPLETWFLDYLAFGVEQFTVGLRKDNPAKIQDQLERVESVDSVTRAAALTEKLYLLTEAKPIPLSNPGQDFQDAVVAHKLQRLGTESTQSKLEE